MSLVAEAALAVGTDAPLVRMLSLETSESTALAVELDDGKGHRLRIEFPGTSSTHDVALLGMKADATYDVGLVLTADDGHALRDSLDIATEPLPDDIPVLSLDVSDADGMSARYTRLDAIRRIEVLVI